MDSWILVVLILISLQLAWMGSRLGATTGKGGLSQELVSELEKIREELYWFKGDNFAAHLFKEIKEHCDSLEHEIAETGEEIEKQFQWFKDDNFAAHLFKEIKENSDSLERQITETNQALQEIVGILDELKEIVSSLHGAGAR